VSNNLYLKIKHKYLNLKESEVNDWYKKLNQEEKETFKNVISRIKKFNRVKNLSKNG